MINKKNVLGKTPQELGDKDAIHVAIVSVRAGRPISPGQRVGMSTEREAVPDANGVGVADPFRTGAIATGRAFWLLLDQDAVPNVRHTWEHPAVDFSPPTRQVVLNAALQRIAGHFLITYDQLMEACSYTVRTGKPAEYNGGLLVADLINAIDKHYDRYDLWSEWAEETGYEFENLGSGCCPEYEYPRELFAVPSL